MKWYVTYSASCEVSHAADSLEEAMGWVFSNVVRPRGHFNFEWKVQIDSIGLPDFARWEGLTRKMTKAEIVDHFFEKAAEFVEFLGSPVSFVQIIRQDRAIAYMKRSDHSGNRKADQARSLVENGETSPVILEMARRKF